MYASLLYKWVLTVLWDLACGMPFGGLLPHCSFFCCLFACLSYLSAGTHYDRMGSDGRSTGALV